MPPALPGIELIDIHTTLGDTVVLRGTSFAAEPGRITVLLGPSGVGKTTCLRHVVGLLVPDEGDVLVEGRSTLSMRKRERLELSRRFGVLLGGSGVYGSALWESMTVEQNLIEQLRVQRDWDQDALLERAQQRLRQVGLAGSARLMPSALSAGMRRRVALARALISDPDYAVLDSLELGVDAVRLAGLCEIIRETHERLGATYLIATQSMELARRLADDVVVLWDGRVIEQAPAGEVLASARTEVHQFVNGLVRGPLGMAGAGHPVVRGGSPPPRHADETFELPLPLVAVALLVAATASVLALGGGKPAEVAIVIAAWVVTLTLSWSGRRRGRSRRRR